MGLIFIGWVGGCGWFFSCIDVVFDNKWNVLERLVCIKIIECGGSGKYFDFVKEM